jgi:Leucine-rich repeat (LRR) protein
MKKLWLLPLALLLLLAVDTEAQNKKPVKKPPVQKAPVQKEPAKKPVVTKKVQDPAADEKQVREIVSFLQYMLNTLGSSSTSSRDKDVLVTESYSKIFRDGKVQVEDDLDDEREVITNKDIVAYLKDVDFFFKDVKFELVIENIKTSTMPNGELFYKVSARRNMTGTTAEGKAVNNSIPRFIEVNFNQQDQDLRIVSIYTNQFNEKEALTNWWKELSYEWQSVFKRAINLTADSAQFSDIKSVTAIQELQLSNNTYIQDLEPLAQLASLRVLNLSGSAVKDLTPIRNLTELTELTLAGTKVNDLSPLRYSNKLETLNINDTDVAEITVVEKMKALQELKMNGTRVADFTPIANLTALQKADLSDTKISNLSPFQNLVQLTELNISETPVADLSPLTGLKNLRELDIDSTQVRNIQPLSNLDNLHVLHANATFIADLMPLQKLAQLEKIYCDQTQVTRAAAEAFKVINPNVLVIFDSKDLTIWWNTLSPEWKNILSKTAVIGLDPSKEELAKVPLLDSINLNGDSRINTLEPLRKLLKLKTILANKTGITDVLPLQGHLEIRYLDISETNVKDISPLSRFTTLRVLQADKSKIENIELYTIAGLEKLYADQTTLHDITAREFLMKNPKCLLIYKTNALNRWWGNLSENWKKVFQAQLRSGSVTRENLHALVEQEVLEFQDAPVTSLSALSEFVQLKELHFSGTAISRISPLDNFSSLKSLHAINSPIHKIDSLWRLTELEDLDISNTPIDDLSVIGRLKKLKKLNCAGTQIRRLDPLEKLQELESLDCSNTNVNKLTSLDYLPLKTLKCYNTKVSNRAIENFKASHPECSVMYYR